MWARLHDGGRIEVLHTAVALSTETHDYSRDIFHVWPPEDLRSILNILPAAYTDQAPSPHHVPIGETAVSMGDHVLVSRTWEDRTPAAPVEQAPQQTTIINQTTTNTSASLELPLMQREADAVLAAAAANPNATFALADYVLLATLVGTAITSTGNPTADIKAAAVHVHKEVRRASEELAAQIRQRQGVAA